MSLLECVDKLNNACVSSMEAIKFQSGSKFPNELEAQMQRVLNFASDHDVKYGPVTNSDEALRKHTKLRAFIIESIGPAISKIIKTHTGIVVTEFYSDLPVSSANAGALYVYLNNINEYTNSVINATQAQADMDLNRSKGKQLKELLTINDSLDKVKGKVLTSIRPFEVIIGLPVGLFCVGDFIKDGAKYQLTAGELTAGMLHEVGHVFAYIEYLSDFAYTGYYGNNPIRDIDDRLKKDFKGTVKEVVAITEATAKHANREVAGVLMSFVPILNKLSSSEITIDDEVSTQGADKYHYKFNMVTVIVMTLVNIIMTMDYLVTAGMMTILSPMLVDLDVMTKSSSKTANVHKRNQLYERLADEYVSRHGRSKDLNTALIKIGNIFDELALRTMPMFNSTIRDSYVTRLLFTILNSGYVLSLVCFGKLFAPLSPYESNLVRLKRNINNLHDNLKDTSIPRELRLKMIGDIDQMEKDINMGSTKVGRLLDKLLTLLISLPGEATTGILMNVLGNRMVMNDYGRLFEQLDELMSNKSFYHATRIGALID